MIIPIKSFLQQTDLTNLYRYGRALNGQTPFHADWINCIWGTGAAVMRAAGMEPNNTPDTVHSSQMLDAVQAILRQRLAAERGVAYELRNAFPAWVQAFGDIDKVLAISADGSFLYLRTRARAGILQFELPTAGDLRGGLRAIRLLQLENVRAIAFRDDGRQLFIVGDSDIRAFALEEPWQIVSAQELVAGKTAHGGTLRELAILPGGLRAIELHFDRSSRWNLQLVIYPEPYRLDGALRPASPAYLVDVPATGQVSGLAVDPSGRHCLIASTRGDDSSRTYLRQIALREFDGGSSFDAESVFESEPVTPEGEAVSGIVWSPNGQRIFAGSSNERVIQLDTFHAEGGA